ncbi:hypothetical protein ACS0TY_024475 [Phlomoides rotata]
MPDGTLRVQTSLSSLMFGTSFGTVGWKSFTFFPLVIKRSPSLFSNSSLPPWCTFFTINIPLLFSFEIPRIPFTLELFHTTSSPTSKPFSLLSSFELFFFLSPSSLEQSKSSIFFSISNPLKLAFCSNNHFVSFLSAALHQSKFVVERRHGQLLKSPPLLLAASQCLLAANQHLLVSSLRASVSSQAPPRLLALSQSLLAANQHLLASIVVVAATSSPRSNHLKMFGLHRVFSKCRSDNMFIVCCSKIGVSYGSSILRGRVRDMSGSQPLTGHRGTAHGQLLLLPPPTNVIAGLLAEGVTKEESKQLRDEVRAFSVLKGLISVDKLKVADGEPNDKHRAQIWLLY